MGDVSQYNIACRCFNDAIFEKKDFQPKNLVTEEDMKNYFSNFAKETLSDEVDEKEMSNKFIAKKIYKGYIDDPLNTDNAWVEAEIWNFHYGDEDLLDEFIPNVSISNKDLNVILSINSISFFW